MSLTSQLQGELGEWCAHRLVGTPDLAAAVAATANRHRPIRPTGTPDLEHWATVGGALGQRLAAVGRCHRERLAEPR